jgi:hypothetical protein
MAIEHALSLDPTSKPETEPSTADAEDQQQALEAAAELADMETAAALPSSFEHEATHHASISIVESEQVPTETSAIRPHSNRYTAVDEDYRKRLGTGEESVETRLEVWTKWLSLIGLLAGGAALIWFFARTPSADQMFINIQAAVESGIDEELIANEDEMQKFLREFPDEPRREQITDWLADVKLALLNRRLERISRSPITPHNVRPIEQLLVKAIRTETNNQASAARQLQGVLALFSAGKPLSDEDQLCVTLAQRRLQQLKQAASGNQEQQRILVVERLKIAAKVARDDPKTARQIRQGIIDLYQEDLWAQEYVNEARQLLAD